MCSGGGFSEQSRFKDVPRKTLSCDICRVSMFTNFTFLALVRALCERWTTLSRLVIQVTERRGEKGKAILLIFSSHAEALSASCLLCVLVRFMSRRSGYVRIQYGGATYAGCKGTLAPLSPYEINCLEWS